MTYSIDLDQTTKQKITIKLYKEVQNVPQLRQKLMNGTLECCIIKPSLIVDPFQIVIAANKAVTSEKLKTRSIYTEILFNLSVSKNITQSLQTFGIDDKNKDILVIVVSKNDKDDLDTSESVFKNVEGEEVSLDLLKNVTDLKTIKRVYKIGDVEEKNVKILDSVITRIAAKDCIL